MRFRGNHQGHVPRPTGKGDTLQWRFRRDRGISENMIPNSEWSTQMTRVQHCQNGKWEREREKKKERERGQGQIVIAVLVLVVVRNEKLKNWGLRH